MFYTNGLNATYTFLNSIFSQGRPGSDGARGMPGQAGPKVSCLAHPSALQFPFIHNKCVFLKHLPKLFFPPSSGRQRLWWSVWTSWWKRKQSESSCGTMESAHVFVLMRPLAKVPCSAVVGWIWTLWTPWCYWRGWREGKAEAFWLFAVSFCRAEWHKQIFYQHQNYPFPLPFSPGVFGSVHTSALF